MSFAHETGNLMQSSAEALVNPVNCKGAMGKGLARVFRNAYPKNHRAYQHYCAARRLQPGHCLIFHELDKWIINFPTKDDWRDPSRIEWIKTGLVDMLQQAETLQIQSIAVPLLGCGLGGLTRNLVLPRIREAGEQFQGTLTLIEPQN